MKTSILIFNNLNKMMNKIFLKNKWKMNNMKLNKMNLLRVYYIIKRNLKQNRMIFIQFLKIDQLSKLMLPLMNG